MNTRKIILIVMIFAFINTVFLSVYAIAPENTPSGADSVSAEAVNTLTCDFIFGVFVAAALIAIITLYLVMRKKYIN